MNSFQGSRNTEHGARNDVHSTTLPDQEALSELLDQFHNFDEPDVYDDYMNRATEKSAMNFAVRVEMDDAHIATNLRDQDIASLLTLRSNEGFDNTAVTWIHLWTAEGCDNVIRTIARHYNFSETLVHSLLTQDVVKKEASRTAIWAREEETSEHEEQCVPESVSAYDGPSQAIFNERFHTPGRSSHRNSRSQTIDDEDYSKMTRVWQSMSRHTTMDHNFNYLCVGAYWPHNGPDLSRSKQAIHRTLTERAALPESMRHKASELQIPKLSKHWAWYILTNDYTVVSIQQAPLYKNNSQDALGYNIRDLNLQDMRNPRKHVKGILAQLSKADQLHMPPSHLRWNRPVSDSVMAKSIIKSSFAADISATLFHDLIDNYSASISTLKMLADIQHLMSSLLLGQQQTLNRRLNVWVLNKVLTAHKGVLWDLRALLAGHERLLEGILSLQFDNLSRKEELTSLGLPKNVMVSPCSGPMPRSVKLPQEIYNRLEQLCKRMRGPRLDETGPLFNRIHWSLLEIGHLLEEVDALSLATMNVTVVNSSGQKFKTSRLASVSSKLWLLLLPLFMVTAIFSVQIPSVADHKLAYPISLGAVGAVSILMLFVY